MKDSKGANYIISSLICPQLSPHTEKESSYMAKKRLPTHARVLDLWTHPSFNPAVRLSACLYLSLSVWLSACGRVKAAAGLIPH